MNAESFSISIFIHYMYMRVMGFVLISLYNTDNILLYNMEHLFVIYPHNIIEMTIKDLLEIPKYRIWTQYFYINWKRLS